MGLQLEPGSLEIDPCNLSRSEHGSWDLPHHMGVSSMTWMPTSQHFLEAGPSHGSQRQGRLKRPGLEPKMW
jgi:hypothetical protein